MSYDEKWLLRINGLFFLTTSLVGIFVNLFIFQLGGLKSVVYYGLISLTALFIVYLSSGYYLKKISSKYSIRLGFLIYSIFYTLLFLLRESSVNYLFILGFINGTAAGFYWVGNNITQYIATHTHSRHEYFGKLSFFVNMGSAIGPSIGGLVIAYFAQNYTKFYGYTTLFALVALLFLIAFLLTDKLPGHKIDKFSYKDLLKQKKLSWKIVLSQQFLYGLMDVSFGSFSSILMFLFLQEEFKLGLVNTLSVLSYAFLNLLAYRILKKKPGLYILGGIGSSLGLLLFGLQQNWLGIAGLILISNAFIPLLNITTSKLFYDTIDNEKEPWQNKYHFLMERDMVLGFARVLVYFCLLFVFTSQNQLNIAKTWVIIVSIIPLIIGLLEFFKRARAP